jgi:thioredoxin reductase
MVEIAIIGAGPYGLSIAAHLRKRGIPFRIFGRPMDSWLAHMPKGMLLKSDGFASTIDDPDGDFTLGKFCAERGIGYSDLGLPVRLDTFSAYGLAFRDRKVPELEEKLVVGVDRLPECFRLRLDDGQTVSAKRIVLAVGITHFEYIPPNLAILPPEFVSHSFQHHDLEKFRGRRVVVVGAGSSAIDLAGLLSDTGADVHLVARDKSLKFHSMQRAGKRSWWQRIRYPKSGLGPGLRSRFFCDAPTVFHYLPERFRLRSVRTHLGPAGGWFAKDRVVGRVPLLLGCSVESGEIRDGRLELRLRSKDGSVRQFSTDHVIAATGYKVDVERLKFLSTSIRSKIKTVNGTPVLSSTFESSVSGLYFVGIAAANSFGPLMRFAYGAPFTARRLTGTIVKSLSRNLASVPANSLMTLMKSRDANDTAMRKDGLHGVTSDEV